MYTEINAKEDLIPKLVERKADTSPGGITGPQKTLLAIGVLRGSLEPEPPIGHNPKSSETREEVS